MKPLSASSLLRILDTSRRALLAVALVTWVHTSAVLASESERIAPSIERQVRVNPEARVVAWVYFTDRAGAERDPRSFGIGRLSISPRSLDRRRRRGDLTEIVASDLPVHAAYVEALRARGARVRGASRWLNAASVEAPARLVASFANLPFVRRVEPVARGRRSPDPVADAVSEAAPPRGEAIAPERRLANPGEPAYYGGSFRQLDMMQVPAVHALGYTGAGVLVCMLDSGFDLTHQALAGINVIATRDFINGDSNVARDSTQDIVSQAYHGTWTLGCVAGSRPGTFSGGAFGASVALGKTEYLPSETPVEMDYWQFGSEWADSLGADIITSSLGYYVFDDTLQSYDYSDMDGKTTVVTRAAAEAVRRGITVLNSAGNEGNKAWHYIIAPADADTLIAVGAVDSLGVRSSFSSFGPSADGRIKPDVTAMGTSVLCVSVSTPTAYQRVSGTSFSCPLTAGVAALLLDAHPTWRPFEVREALRETALNHASPNSSIGWGLVQALAALNWVPSTTGISDRVTRPIALAAGPNPLRPGSFLGIRLSAPAGSSLRLEVLDVSGRRRALLYRGASEGAHAFSWTGLDDRGERLSAGVYWLRLESDGLGTARASRSVRVVLLP